MLKWRQRQLDDSRTELRLSLPVGDNSRIQALPAARSRLIVLKWQRSELGLTRSFKKIQSLIDHSGLR